MEFIVNLAVTSFERVLLTLQHNWPYLMISVLIAALLKLFVNTAKVSAFLNRNRGAGVLAATVASVATPLCSCGTTAVVLGMMASTMPWAPIVSFMVASPLSSPEGLVYSAGIFGWPFALTFYVASIIMGLASGWITAVIEKSGWLSGQTRFTDASMIACSCSAPSPSRHAETIAIPLKVESSASTCCGARTALLTPAPSLCGCSARLDVEVLSGSSLPNSAGQDVGNDFSRRRNVTLVEFLKELLSSGKKLLLMFLGFAFIGYMINGLIPSSWVSTLFGSGNIYNVPLAATLGLPFYINSEASIPLVRAMIENGMSQGAALAFMIAGSGTSIGAITGALTIARWRVVGLVVAFLWLGAIISGLVFNWILAL
jgi:uncharacterized membrane protein YraQ (UPF0718 family)